MAGFDSRPAKCWACCRARTRQALCKANAASRRLVLVSGRLVSLALFIVSATRHLLEMRLCPLRPCSTAQRELVNIFSKAKCLRGPRSEAATVSANETGVPSDFSPRSSDGRHRKTEEDFTVGRVSRARCCLLAPRAVVCLVSSVWSMLANYFGS